MDICSCRQRSFSAGRTRSLPGFTQLKRAPYLLGDRVIWQLPSLVIQSSTKLELKLSGIYVLGAVDS